MNSLKEWLNRGSKKKVRKPMRKVSKKRVGANREYYKRRKAFLEAHPYCQGKRQVGICSENHVGTVIHDCFNKSRDVHHVKGRLEGNLLDETTWLAVCRPCHDYIHAHPSQSRELGLLQ